MTKREPTGDAEADELAELAIELDRRHTALVAAFDQILAAALAGETVTRRWARWEERRDRLQVEIAAVALRAREGLVRVRHETPREEAE